MERKTRDKWYVLLVYAGLIVAAVAAFEPVRHNGFVNFDDDIYITENDRIKGGLTSDSISWAFTNPHHSMYHPLTTISYMLDYEFFGADPLWYHLESLLFHIVNTVLVFWVLKRMTGAVWCSAFVAGVFALHPLSVESVAWASERKNVLSGFFWLLTIGAYIRYAERPFIGRYLRVMLMLCLGLLSKPIVVTLPFVLLLLDYWPLSRFQSRAEAKQKAQGTKPTYQKATGWGLVCEKIPLFVLAGILSVITYLVQKGGRVVVSTGALPLSVRISNAGVSYVRYIGKIICPVRLGMYYPYHSLPMWLVIVCFAVLVVISAAVIYMARRRGYLLVGWLWFLGTLVPVIGLVQAGSQAMADRYTYLSSIGILIMIAWGAAEISAQWELKFKKVLAPVVCVVILGVLLVLTRIQVGYWRDSNIMFEHTLAVTKDNRIVHKLYGDFLRKEGRLPDAMEQFDKALQISPEFHGAREGKGLTLSDMKQYDEAIAIFGELLAVRQDWPEVHDRLGVAYAGKNELAKAVEHFNKALELKRDWPEVWNDLGTVYRLQGKYDQAVQCHKEALKLRPGYREAEYNLAIAIKLQGQAEESGKNQP
ncbi:MAG: tetratricopeptide repeat protein [Planctomycetota bacterium]|jgi:Flp pilus assembly protein TadD